MSPRALPDQVRSVVRSIHGLMNRMVGVVNVMFNGVDAIRDRGESRRSARIRKKRHYRFAPSADYSPPRPRPSTSQFPANNPSDLWPPQDSHGIDPKGPIIVTTTQEMTNGDSMAMALEGVSSVDMAGGSTCLSAGDQKEATKGTDDGPNTKPWRKHKRNISIGNPILSMGALPEPKIEPEFQQLTTGDQIEDMKGTRLDSDGSSTKPLRKHKRNISIGKPILEMPGLPVPAKELDISQLAEVRPTSATRETEAEDGPKSMTDRTHRRNDIVSTFVSAVGTAICGGTTSKNNKRIVSMSHVQILEKALKEEKERVKKDKKAEQEQSKQLKKDEKKQANEAKKAGKEQGKQIKQVKEDEKKRAKEAEKAGKEQGKQMKQVKEDEKKRAKEAKKAGKEQGKQIKQEEKQRVQGTPKTAPNRCRRFSGTEWILDQYGSMTRKP